MKSRNNFLYFLALVLLLVACNRQTYFRKDKNFDFDKIKTYTWIRAQNDSLAHKFNSSDLTGNVIRKSVDKNLQENGWKRVKKNPDVLIVYDMNIKKENVAVSDPVYSQPLARWYYNPYRGTYTNMYYPTELMGFDNSVETIREGTLTLTILNARTEKKIWQGWTKAEMNGKRLTDKEIDDNVKAIIRKLDK